jgi:DNA-binding LacI/PurR family transcriptional regulator
MDGLIVFSPVRGDPLLPQIRRRGTPMVLVGRDPDGKGLDPCVDNDHVAGTRSVFDHLEACGATRPALLGVALGDAFTEDCLTGYRDWCAARSARPRILMIPAGLPPRQTDAMIRAFLTGADRADALHATVWEVGARTAEVTLGLGLQIPRDLMITACGDTEPLPDEPQITQLKLFPELAARESMDLLMTLVRGTPSQIDRTIPTELVIRDSTGRR